MRVPCAFCGERSVEEFMYGEVPTVPDDLVEAGDRDLDRVYMRTNPTGPAPEAWFHAYGCRRWSYLSRHRTTGSWE